MSNLIEEAREVLALGYPGPVPAYWPKPKEQEKAPLMMGAPGAPFLLPQIAPFILPPLHIFPGIVPGAVAGAPGGGPGGDIASQLRAGFIAAGHPELAALVGTADFNAWIEQESGWNPSIVGAGLGANRRTAGLFQFMYFESRDWLDPFYAHGPSYTGPNEFTASPYQQAIWAATHFSLTPSDIHSYAAQIRAGTYKGWG